MDATKCNAKLNGLCSIYLFRMRAGMNEHVDKEKKGGDAIIFLFEKKSTKKKDKH